MWFDFKGTFMNVFHMGTIGSALIFVWKVVPFGKKHHIMLNNALMLF